MAGGKAFWEEEQFRQRPHGGNVLAYSRSSQKTNVAGTKLSEGDNMEVEKVRAQKHRGGIKKGSLGHDKDYGFWF